MRVEGKFLASDGTTPELGQDIIATLLERCYSVAENALQRWIFSIQNGNLDYN